MASSSSTFSSDPRPSETECAGHGFPWALALAVALVAGVELFVRRFEPRDLIAYETGVPERYAARYHIQSYGAPEVSFVGSSRVHMGILCPVVSEELAARCGRPVGVANFASGGALIEEIEPLVAYMMRHEPVPRLLLYGVDPEQVRGPQLYNDRSPIFWSLDDLWCAQATVDADVGALWPDVLRNHLADAWLTFRYRARPVHWLKAMHRGRDTSPMLGEYPAGMRVTDPPGADRSLAAFPADAEEVKHHVETAHLDHGRYPFNDRKLEMFARLIDGCRERDVRVVLFEVPNAQVFNQYLPADVYPSFFAMMRGIAERGGARFVSLDELSLKFGDEDFRDPVHLNVRGAKELSRALTTKVIAPELLSIEARAAGFGDKR